MTIDRLVRSGCLAAITLLCLSGCATIKKRIQIAQAFANVYEHNHAYRAYTTPSTAMMPTIHPNTTTLIVDLSAFVDRAPRRGEIVVFSPPEENQGVYIKRIVGIPGDRVAIRRGTVSVNGMTAAGLPIASHPDYTLELRDRRFVVDGAPLDAQLANVPAADKWSAPDALPAGCYVVIGDNTTNSEDSHVFGCAQVDGSFFSGPRKGQPIAVAGAVVKIVDDR